MGGAVMGGADLGQTDDPKKLIPGNPEAIGEVVRSFRDQGDKLEDVGLGLGAIRIDGWTGSASNAFWDKFAPEKTNWLRGHDALQEAAKALSRYADAVQAAQHKAADAIELWEQGEAATRQARAEHEQAVAGNEATGVAGVGACAPDPGEQLRQQAREVLTRARGQLSEEGERVASAIRDQGGNGQGSPRWLAQAAGVVQTAMNEYGAGRFRVSQELAELGNTQVPDENMRQRGHQTETAAAEGGATDQNNRSSNATLFELSKEANLFEASAQGETQLGDVTLSGSAEVTALGVEGSASAYAGPDGVGLQAEGRATLLGAAVEGSAAYGPAEVGGSAEGFGCRVERRCVSRDGRRARRVRGVRRCQRRSRSTR
jgi:uncharacterized protein YukE